MLCGRDVDAGRCTGHSSRKSRVKKNNYSNRVKELTKMEKVQVLIQNNLRKLIRKHLTRN